MGKRVMVTGAAGFMGSHLVDMLLHEGHEVHAVDDLSGGYRSNVSPDAHFYQLDLRDQAATDRVVRETRPELLCHLAADATEGRSQFTPINCTQRNYNAYLNVLVPAIREGMEKVVLTSSMSVYGAQKPPFDERMEPKPEDIYAIAKAAMEHATAILSDVYSFRYTIIRPHNVYGPRQNLADPYRNVVGIFINRLLQSKHFYIYGDGDQKRAFTYIDDFTPYLYHAAFESRCDGETINVGPREEYSINQLATVVMNTFGLDPSTAPDHMRPEYLPLRPREVVEAYCTNDRAKELLGYETSISLEDGVRRMVAWARELGPQVFHYLPDGLELTTADTPRTWVEQLI